MAYDPSTLAYQLDTMSAGGGTVASPGAAATTTWSVNGVDLAVEQQVFTDAAAIYGANDSLGSATSDDFMTAVRYDGNLTINAGVKLTPQARKRGMAILVKGNCTIDGELTMTARGAANVAGQDILILDIAEGSIPATGGAGGVFGAPRQDHGTPGEHGTGGGTGGGGSGASGWGSDRGSAGAAGTSYSGGSGGGASAREAVAIDAQPNGGAGGVGGGRYGNYYGGGGAGNPGGEGGNTTVGGNVILSGEDGTGGLLILIVEGQLAVAGVVSANGSNGGVNDNLSSGNHASGGGSGGGSVNLYVAGESYITGTIEAVGGIGPDAGWQSSRKDGGAGGNGTTRVVQIELAAPVTSPLLLALHHHAAAMRRAG
jgi:hypothetical protein